MNDGEDLESDEEGEPIRNGVRSSNILLGQSINSSKFALDNHDFEYINEIIPDSGKLKSDRIHSHRNSHVRNSDFVLNRASEVKSKNKAGVDFNKV